MAPLFNSLFRLWKMVLEIPPYRIWPRILHRRTRPVCTALVRSPVAYASVYAVGYVIVAVMIFALAAPLIAPYSPITTDPSAYLLPPSFSHLPGTDVPGMDVLSRAIFAPGADLVVALVGTGISASTGTLLGAC
jgi:ABC-type dipeptide/oligopeptide/nickel transport system permease subunit